MGGRSGGSIEDLEVDREQVGAGVGVALEMLMASVEEPVGVPLAVEADGAEIEEGLGAGA
jgi:hypothetical protein